MCFQVLSCIAARVSLIAYKHQSYEVSVGAFARGCHDAGIAQFWLSDYIGTVNNKEKMALMNTGVSARPALFQNVLPGNTEA